MVGVMYVKWKEKAGGVVANLGLYLIDLCFERCKHRLVHETRHRLKSATTVGAAA